MNDIATPEADASPAVPTCAPGRSFEGIHKERKKTSNRMLRRIARFRANGKEKSAEYLERCYERSQHAKTTALIRANGDLPKAARLDLFRKSRAGIANPSSPDEEAKIERDRQYLLALADDPQMNLSLRCDEEVQILWKAKASGKGYRNMHAFGLQKRARQIIVCDILKPLAKAKADPRQFAIFGGGHQAAIAWAKELAPTMRWSAELDIKNSYPSFDLRPQEITGYQFATIPLPQAIIDHVLMTEGDANLTTSIGSSYDNPYGNTPNPIKLLLEARRGLPQGSPGSSLVQEMFVADLLRLVPDTETAKIINCADNFRVQARTKEEVSALIKTLKEALAFLSAGQVSFSQKQEPRHVRYGMDFLGHRLKFSKGTFEVAPLERSLDQFRKKALELATRFDRHRSERTWRDLWRYVRSFRSAYPHWTKPDTLHGILWFMFASRFRFGAMTKPLADLLTAPRGTPFTFPALPERPSEASSHFQRVRRRPGLKPGTGDIPRAMRSVRSSDIWRVRVVA
ncbi:hypothetical protein GOL32_12290 [Sinorhizobium medicae]|nr:hypothetical protein [Sinorhizobium medicae]